MFHTTSSLVLRHVTKAVVPLRVRFSTYFELTDSSASISSSSPSSSSSPEDSVMPPVKKTTFSDSQRQLQSEFLDYYVRMKVSTSKASPQELTNLSALEKQVEQGDLAKTAYVNLVKEILKRPKKN